MDPSAQFSFVDHPHRRYNPLNGTWVLVSPHRAKRPWLGQTEQAPVDDRPPHDPTCYLCPGNARSNGAATNPHYSSTFVFTNDFPALLTEQPVFDLSVAKESIGLPNDADSKTKDLLSSLYRVQGNRGTSRVVCFSPRHDRTLAELSVAEIEDVVKVWIEQYLDLASKDFVGYVQIFENKGAMMGCSAPHPHGQIWATEEVPTEPARELASLATYKAEKDRCLLCDYLDSELRGSRTRIVCENDSFVVLVPFWAVWPFETMVLPKRHLSAVPELSEVERKDFADILKRITVRYDGLFSCSFPYSAGIHQSPTGNQANADFHMHMHFYPPLLRSSTVKKFLVGFEMLAEAQRDLTPEQTAERLRALPEIHFKDAEKTEM